MGLQQFLKLRRMCAPELLYFDHLNSEYLVMRAAIPPGQDLEALDALIKDGGSKRADQTLTWNDIYSIELALAYYHPVDSLRSKIIRLRYNYRSIAGQAEFDDYMASKPPDLMSPPDPVHPPAVATDYETLLREDLKDLLGRIFLRYAILPVREAKLKGLTWWAAGLCLASLLAVLVSMAVIFFFDGKTGHAPSPVIFVVVVAGAIGGFVSALQRIQVSPSDGDSFYSLSLLFNGSYAVFVAPITGGIFALILYLMFTGHVLEGRFFPAIYSPAQSIVAPPTPGPAANGSSSARAGSSDAGPEQTPTRPAATPVPVPANSIGIEEFLQSGPAGGQDYALLIIWCFIAGFAERFVPDALDRLISSRQKSETGEAK